MTRPLEPLVDYKLYTDLLSAYRQEQELRYSLENERDQLLLKVEELNRRLNTEASSV